MTKTKTIHLRMFMVATAVDCEFLTRRGLRCTAAATHRVEFRYQHGNGLIETRCACETHAVELRGPSDARRVIETRGNDAAACRRNATGASWSLSVDVSEVTCKTCLAHIARVYARADAASAAARATHAEASEPTVTAAAQPPVAAAAPKATAPKTLYSRRASGLVLKCERVGSRVVFSGGKRGTHDIDGDSSTARVLAHWAGYCEANGLRATPAVGELLHFARGMFGAWPAVVAAVHRSRVTLSYRTRRGNACKCTVAIADLYFV